MGYYLIKAVITAILVVAISEVAKRSSLVGGILASVPITSVLAMVWLYVDTGDVGKVSALATSVAWLVLPSLVLFVLLPWLLHRGVPFPLGLVMAIAATALAYGGMVLVLARFGIRL
ncbi:hypothetical protein AN478_11045 [Thiohalorhabdus denitrificans]|uniref:DUF3147 family protein n=1 Tax=Thiohalorhabdus denitrificans TaxID=381306 RepID=A0A0P9C3U1_9GAMM|nr:DUF3147 family protein [Thiohalorhabdus denitrificans]KPV39650.1 hypothetical protein AN478_11045 [Thiohalorhabdus denitrificans]SCX95414.1 hypothetical protein SAMN05661077_0824 [Thiohalorhabdus denitrificans]